MARIFAPTCTQCGQPVKWHSTKHDYVHVDRSVKYLHTVTVKTTKVYDDKNLSVNA